MFVSKDMSVHYKLPSLTYQNFIQSSFPACITIFQEFDLFML